MHNKLIILRISNVIGEKKNLKKLHKTFIDMFFQNIKNGYILDNKKDYKDFISIDKFCEIVKNIIKKDLTGIFNVSIGKKIILNDVIYWLNKFNKKKIIKKFNNIKNENFYLNNQKLMSRIKIKNSITELRNYCYKISKKSFN